MMINRRLFLAGSTSAAAAVALTACSNSDSSDSGDGSTPESLTFWLSGDGNEGGGYAALAEKYEEETGIHIEIVDVPNEDFMTKLKNAALADDLPDIGGVPSVDPIWKDDLVDLTDIAEERGIMDAFLVYDDEGKTYALPNTLTSVGLYVNKSLFDEAGVSYPTAMEDTWTWDEFIEAITEVQDATGAKYGTIIDASSHRLRAFLYQMGSNGFQRDENGEFYTNDKTKPALEFFKEINNDTTVPRSVWLSGDDASAMFKSGQVVSYYSGNWQLADFTENITDFEWESAFMPAQPTVAGNIGSGGVMVAFSTGGNGQAAHDFIDWMYQAENYTQLCETASALPAIDGLDVTYEFAQDSYDIYNAEIAAADPVSGYQYTSQLEWAYEGKALEGDPLREETVKYLNDEQDVDTTIANVISLMNEQVGGTA